MSSLLPKLPLLLGLAIAIPGQAFTLVHDFNPTMVPRYGTLLGPYVEVGQHVFGSLNGSAIMRFDPSTGANNIALRQPQNTPFSKYGAAALRGAPIIWALDRSNTLWLSQGTESSAIRLRTGPDPIVHVVGDGNALFTIVEHRTGTSLYRYDGLQETELLRHPAPRGIGRVVPLSASKALILAGQETRGLWTELWITDGTPSGTTLLRSQAHGWAKTPVPFKNGAIFVGFDTATGYEPHFTDGTPAGTKLLWDIYPGTRHSSPEIQAGVEHNGNFVFAAEDGVHGQELWTTDGTPAGTRLLVDAGPSSSRPSNLASAKHGLVFTLGDRRTGLHAFDGTKIHRLGTPGLESDVHALTTGVVAFTSVMDPELLLTDGTIAGTKRVKLLAGPQTGRPAQITALAGGGAVFRATSLYGDLVIWRTDGTAASTRVLFDPTPGTQPGNSIPRFDHGRQATSDLLFVSVAQPTNDEGTYAVQGGVVTRLTYSRPDFGQSDLKPGEIARRGKVLRVFPVSRSDGNVEAWVTDGTTAGTFSLDVVPGPKGSRGLREVVSLDDRVLFAADSARGNELWVSNGTKIGTVLLGDLLPGAQSSNPVGLTRLGNRVIFTARDAASTMRLWATDGTANGTRPIATIPPNFPSVQLTVIDDAIYYLVGPQLWQTDGTQPGTTKVGDLALTRGHQLFGIRGSVYLRVDVPGATELYRWNGTAATRVARVPDTVTEITVCDHVAYLRANRQLWLFDSTTQQVSPTGARGYSVLPTGGSSAYFIGATPATGLELFHSDGTAAGTQLVAEMRPGPDHGCFDLALVGDQVYVIADSPTTGMDLYRLSKPNEARAIPVGDGCHEFGHKILSASAPALGSTAKIEGRVPAAVPAIVLMLGVPAPTPAIVPATGGCVLRLAPNGPLASLGVVLRGAFTAPLPIPNVASLHGMSVVVQAAATQPRFATSNALQLVLGH